MSAKKNRIPIIMMGITATLMFSGCFGNKDNPNDISNKSDILMQNKNNTEDLTYGKSTAIKDINNFEFRILNDDISSDNCSYNECTLNPNQSGEDYIKENWQGDTSTSIKKYYTLPRVNDNCIESDGVTYTYKGSNAVYYAASNKALGRSIFYLETQNDTDNEIFNSRQKSQYEGNTDVSEDNMLTSQLSSYDFGNINLTELSGVKVTENDGYKSITGEISFDLYGDTPISYKDGVFVIMENNERQAVYIAGREDGFTDEERQELITGAIFTNDGSDILSNYDDVPISLDMNGIESKFSISSLYNMDVCEKEVSLSDDCYSVYGINQQLKMIARYTVTRFPEYFPEDYRFKFASGGNGIENGIIFNEKIKDSDGNEWDEVLCEEKYPYSDYDMVYVLYQKGYVICFEFSINSENEFTSTDAVRESARKVINSFSQTKGKSSIQTEYDNIVNIYISNQGDELQGKEKTTTTISNSTQKTTKKKKGK